MRILLLIKHWKGWPYLLVTVTALLIPHCSLRIDKSLSSSPTSPPTDRALKAFEFSVYTYTRQNCIGCHAKTQDPKFAQDDVHQAYMLSRLYVDFDQVPQSTFVRRTTNGHCGQPCLTDGEEMASAIQRWWDVGEKEEIHVIPSAWHFTEALPLPEPLPSGAQFALMEWGLDAWGKEFSQSSISIEVQRWDDASYRFRKPRFMVGEHALHFSRFAVAVNGMVDPNVSVYLSLDKLVGVNMSPVASHKTMLVSQKTDSDGISIAIGDIATAPNDLNCRATVGFAENVLPVFEAKCFRCHRGEKEEAYRWLPMDGTLAEICRQALGRLDLNSPFDSPLITYPLFQANDHPVRILNSSEAQKMLRWVQEEKSFAP